MTTKNEIKAANARRAQRPAPLRDAVVALLAERGEMRADDVVKEITANAGLSPEELKKKCNVIRVMMCQGAYAGYWKRIEKGVYAPLVCRS
jgi:hypothetical protein